MKILNVGSGGRPNPEWVNLDYMNPVAWKVRARKASFAANYVNHKLPSPFPFEDGQFDGIYCAQVVEHFNRNDAMRLMAEFRRVLRPGGVARVIVPDLEYQCRYYLDALETQRRARLTGEASAESDESYEFSKLWLLDQFVRRRPGGDWSDFVRKATSSELRERFRFPPPESRVPKRKLNIPAPANHLRTVRRGELHQWAYDSVDLVQLGRDTGFAESKLVSFDQSEVQGFVAFDQDESGELQPGSLYLEVKR